MLHGRVFVVLATATAMVAAIILAGPVPAAGQPAASSDQPQHQHPPPPPASQVTPAHGRQFMSDGIVFGTFNRQGGPRGDTEFKVQNWWMGMWSRPLTRGSLQFNAMFSLDPATVGKRGYSEIFQAGEAADGRPLIDRQHPHDLLMQLAAVWRRPLTDKTTLTLAGGPIGEPALGPVAFMHRASAAENPTSPLGHHTMDSTHIGMGVITAAVDRAPWTIETSLFNGREPDENRWDIMDPGPLDSWSARLWLRSTPGWEFQVSHGFLREPEELEPGNLRRTTASAGWMRRSDPDFTAVTAVFGRNDKDHGAFHGFLTEATHHVGLNSIYGRFEIQQVETPLLLANQTPRGVTLPPSCPSLVHCVGGQTGADVLLTEARDTVLALTLGGARDVLRTRGFELGIGGDVVFYGVPTALENAYGSRPVSFHVFVRVRPPAAAMGRMWNMTMIRPMEHGGMPMGHGMPATKPASPTPAPVDPHAGHAMPKTQPAPTAPARDPHAGHGLPTPPATEAKPAKVMDPVTGLMVDPRTAPKATYQGQTYYFSSEQAREEFLQNPAKFVKRPKS